MMALSCSGLLLPTTIFSHDLTGTTHDDHDDDDSETVTVGAAAFALKQATHPLSSERRRALAKPVTVACHRWFVRFAPIDYGPSKDSPPRAMPMV
uniref:Putative secreted peptide n=1 Tax=Anopheles braziliensis TaxID=58242 RepID=A0A2M3ZVP0_9DIPT